mgnify:FL=1|tara:strand:- start:1031 stop:1222 length:192 start_codon:yes stop_codon:yes gene_type:complete
MKLNKMQTRWEEELPSEANGTVKKRSKFKYSRLTKNNKEAVKMIEEGYKVKLICGYVVGLKEK